MKEYFLKVIVHVNCLWTEQIRSVLLRWLYHYRGILSLQTGTTIMADTKAKFSPS